MTNVVYPASSGGIDHIGLPAHNFTITQFAGRRNRAILDLPVVDNTGLSGRYNFEQIAGNRPAVPGRGLSATRWGSCLLAGLEFSCAAS